MAIFSVGQRVRILHAAKHERVIGCEAIVVDTSGQERRRGRYGPHDIGVFIAGFNVSPGFTWTYTWAIAPLDPIPDDAAKKCRDREIA